MIVAVTGSSGLIGSALVTALRAGGHEVRRLVRRRPSRSDEIPWDPAAGQVGDLTGVTAAVHPAGAGVSDHRWTAAYRRTIRDSRLAGTCTFAAALARLDPPPAVLVSGSAIGWYGDTGARATDETAPAGEGFLADVVTAWEAAAEPARAAGLRLGLGGFAGEILASQRVVPAALTAAGFRFAHPDADAVARAALGD